MVVAALGGVILAILVAGVVVGVLCRQYRRVVPGDTEQPQAEALAAAGLGAAAPVVHMPVAQAYAAPPPGYPDAAAVHLAHAHPAPPQYFNQGHVPGPYRM